MAGELAFPTPEAAFKAYDQALARAGGREVGIYRNTASPHGEYAVVVGEDEHSVKPPDTPGKWESVLHQHPNPENVLTRRMPAPKDVANTRASAREGGRAVTEFIDYPLPDGRRALVVYTVEPSGRVTLQFKRADGSPVVRHFESVQEYAGHYSERKTYVDPKGSEYPWMMKDVDELYSPKAPSQESTAVGVYKPEPAPETPAAEPPEGKPAAPAAVPQKPDVVKGPEAEEPAPAEAKSARETAREELRRRIEDLQRQKAEANELLRRLDQQIFEQTGEVNRLRERANNEPRGTDARAKAIEEFKAAKESLEGLKDQQVGTYEQRAELTRREAAAARARPGRSPVDIDAERANENKDPPQASDTPATVGDSPTQNADAKRWVDHLRKLGAIDIRVDQIQVDKDYRVVGANRPDLQFKLNGERFYVEWDRPSSARGPEHAIRIQTNDPSAIGVLQITVRPGYSIPDLAAGSRRILLITME